MRNLELCYSQMQLFLEEKIQTVIVTWTNCLLTIRISIFRFKFVFFFQQTVDDGSENFETINWFLKICFFPVIFSRKHNCWNEFLFIKKKKLIVAKSISLTKLVYCTVNVIYILQGDVDLSEKQAQLLNDELETLVTENELNHHVENVRRKR